MATGTPVGNSVPIANTLVQTVTLLSGGCALAFGSFDAGGGDTTTLTSVVGTAGETWTVQGSVQLDSTTHERFYCYGAVNTPGASSIVTVTVSASPGDGSILIVPSSGRDTSTPFGTPQFAVGSPGTGANAVTTAAITAATGDDILMWMADLSAIQTGNFSAGTAFTEKLEIGSGSGQIDAMVEAHDSVSSGSVTPVATSANNDRLARIAINLKAASGGGPTNWGAMLAQQLNRVVQGTD